jgi:hypothetical protein
MRKLVASCSAVLIATAALAACGSSGSSKANNTPTTSAGGASSPSDSDLAKLVADANKQKFKITYTDGSGTTQTYEQDGNGNSVYGSEGSLTFLSKSSIVNCDKSSGSYECTETPASEGSAGSPFSGIATALKSQLSALGGRFGSTSSKTIAGRDAQCVTFSMSDIVGSKEKASYSYCIDKNTGATLEVAVDNGGKRTTSLLVTKFESPSASDFTPPATPSTIPQSISVPGGASITLPSIPGNG